MTIRPPLASRLVFGIGGGSATTVGLPPPIGSATVLPRDRVESIARVAGLKGVMTYKFVSRDGIPLMETGATYSRSDLEQFAQFIAVPLRWDADK